MRAEDLHMTGGDLSIIFYLYMQQYRLLGIILVRSQQGCKIVKQVKLRLTSHSVDLKPDPVA